MEKVLFNSRILSIYWENGNAIWLIPSLIIKICPYKRKTITRIAGPWEYKEQKGANYIGLFIHFKWIRLSVNLGFKIPKFKKRIK